MSRINGEKARSAVDKKRRTAMREKSRAAKAAAIAKAGAAPKTETAKK
ncbi:MAG TPA: hypothetical protein VF698_17580 [Thermoanaerobaculia bacterium]|jgi:hypothetical protein